KYGCPCTFNINTGLFGANWTWVADAVGKPGLSHLRWTKKELQTGIYDGFDVEVHTLSHGSLKTMNDKNVINEVGKDAKNIAALMGFKPVGMAYPGGDQEVNEHNIETIIANTDIRFGRGVKSTYNFKLPEYFMMWQPTCSFSDGQLMSLTKRFIEAKCTEDMVLYVWGHGYELDAYDTWDKFELFVKTITEAAANDDDIVLVTNAEFYQLFKDQIPAWKE
ncbi:MAG: polysaccharide deacetylase family protein, partial [Clostridia bacterium]|nr:polysaccharide deacetylase family protein [Clostridia bacterium]